MSDPYLFNWEPIYQAYLPWLASAFLFDYEHHRDLGGDGARKRYPDAVPVKYEVDKDRYDQKFWEGLVLRCCNHGQTFSDLLFNQSGRMWNTLPWPGALEDWIFTYPVRTYIGGDAIPYLDVLVKMADDDKRREWILRRTNMPGNDIPESEIFAHRILFREHDRIIGDRTGTARALYELMDYSKRYSLEKNLEDNLQEFFSTHFPECLPSNP